MGPRHRGAFSMGEVIIAAKIGDLWDRNLDIRSLHLPILLRVFFV